MTADAMVLIEGEYGVSPEFEWHQVEHETVIEKIADTNAVDSEWSVLRDIFKYKLSENVLQFIKDSEAQPEPAPASGPPPIPDPPFVPLSDSPDLVTTDGPLPPDAPPPPSPSPPYLVSPLVALDLQPSTPLGLVIAPFQPRPNLELNGAGMNGNGAVWDTGSGRALPAKLTTDEAKEELGRVFGYLHDFDEAPPFTVQRLAELTANPRGHYKSAGKYIRALERTLLVTSTHKDYPLDTYALDIQNGAPSTIGGTPSVSSRASTPAPLDLARSPLFTPIPFLHRAAPNSNHRSLSRSPPPTSPRGPLPGDASGDANISGPGIIPDSSIPALGLVDELDDPRPGHLSDHPTALSSVTQLPEDVAGAVVGASALGDRFVSAGSVEPEAQGEGVAGGENVPIAEVQRKAEDAEGYVRASTPEPSPTRVLAEETREREIAAAVAENEKSAEIGGNTNETPPEGESVEGTAKEEEEGKNEESDRMVVDEPDEDKENVPS